MEEFTSFKNPDTRSEPVALPRIAQVGAGCVGAASGRVLADRGFTVTFVDIAESVRTRLAAEGHLAVSPDELDAAGIDIFLVSVPTYTTPDLGGLRHLEVAARQIGRQLARIPHYAVVVIRSTVTPGTAENLIVPILEECSGKQVGVGFGVAVNPEYLREESAMDDFLDPPTVVIGADDERAADMVARLYDWADCPIHRVPLRDAEMQKIVHNVFNAAKISFFNEAREACARSGVDAERIFPLVAQSAEGMRSPVYGTRDFGPFGGMCLPKDSNAYLAYLLQIGLSGTLARAVLAVNEECHARNGVAAREA